MADIVPVSDETSDPPVRGFLHKPSEANGDGLILTHGAGTNRDAPLLVALGSVFAERGYGVLRCDLPFRQKRPSGPPFPAQAERDRAGLRNAVTLMREDLMREKATRERTIRDKAAREGATGKGATGRVFLGGHSYGGRQASMLCAAEPDLVAGLLLLSYPLHPARKPEQLRTQHFPNLRTPGLFVHGTRDPLGSVAEMTEALRLVSANTQLTTVEGAGHDLGFKGRMQNPNLPARIFEAFVSRSEPRDTAYFPLPS